MEMSQESTVEISNNQESKLRRSTRLTNKFQKLPPVLINKIFSKLEDDPKTLIRCFGVCENWAFFVSKTPHLSLRFSSTGAKGRYLACSKLHQHIPITAIRRMMKWFANLESLEIKFCRTPSSLLPYYQRFHQNITKMTVPWADDDSQTDICVAFDIGPLSSIDKAKVKHDFNKDKLANIENSSVMDFYWRVSENRPETLRSMVVRSAKMDVRRLGGKVFIRHEQLSNLHNSISNSRLNESWLEDPKNVVYWDKNHTNKENLLLEQVWLVYRLKKSATDPGSKGTELIAKENDVKDLLAALDDACNGWLENPDNLVCWLHSPLYSERFRKCSLRYNCSLEDEK
ncbi:unnamed protein product [Dovyalis caffra]|uniref:F-box domain-containing protein n=1 Tax=Dovyalis caffra TaxID=77055 RepID=A0AAV1RVP8_9ROSI|nr:unnamed protein product [Dovyalis caffra]